ncbi:MAG: PGL/p-HBAD biosynthesis glycosyltransferase [Candidatus Izimaplasma bacterium HR2]|nr:MAG: PGL/p-HBAD biosynthesis glycosyltransferase [Candidatus Izimaplasma bacterium HR2]
MNIINPIVSLITVTFNSERTIKDTIDSILEQTYDNIEYIIIDGLSSDKTLDICMAYKMEFLKRKIKYTIISERDNGLYDAMNKGILHASGDIIGILNSDDFYIDENVISKVVKKMNATKTEFLYADLLFVDQADTSKIVRKWIAKKGNFKFGWNPPHPTTFISKRLYSTYGIYKTKYTISSDYDMLYRLAVIGKVELVYLNEFITKMRVGGKSTSGFKSNIVASIEIYSILNENNHRFKLFTIILRIFRKIFQ